MRKELCLAAILCLSGMISGCAKTEEPKTEEKAPVKEEKKYDLTIGKKSSDAMEAVLKNETGSAVKNVQIKGNSEEDDQYSDNLLAKDEILKEGQTAQWYYVPDQKNEAYDVKIGLDNDTTIVLHDFSFEKIDGEAVLHVENGVGYITYTNKADQKEVSTLEAEKEANKPEETPTVQTDEQSAAQQAPAEEPVYQEPVYQEPVVQEPVYQEPVYQEPVVQPQPEAPAQGSEGCLGGDIEILN